MATAVLAIREQVLSTLGNRWDAAFEVKKAAPDVLPSVLGGIPRGALTEIAGPACSGRTSLLCSLLAEATARGETCVLVDADDRFDPVRSEAAGVRLDHVLWVRCGGNAEHAMKAADLLAHNGGFGLIAVDFGDTPVRTLHRVPMAAWFRLRQAAERTSAALVVTGQQAHTQSCAAFRILLKSGRARWKGRLPGAILDGLETVAQCVRDHRAQDRALSIAQLHTAAA